MSPAAAVVYAAVMVLALAAGLLFVYLLEKWSEK